MRRPREGLGLWIPILVLTPFLWPALLFEYARYKPFRRPREGAR